MRLHLTFLFFCLRTWLEILQASLEQLASGGCWLLFFFLFVFFSSCKWEFYLNDLVSGLDGSMQKHYCEHLLCFIRAAPAFKRTPRWCRPRKSDICPFSRLCYWLQLWITVKGAFIIMGTKKKKWLSVWQLLHFPPFPAFTHYFNDESLSRAGSLPTSFLLLVINCDTALASN